jgi:hypothetical protein
MSFETFNLLSPVIFLGGAAAALILCLPVLVRLRTGKNGRGTVSINGIELRTERLALGIAAAAILSGGILVAYTALEQLRTIVR